MLVYFSWLSLFSISIKQRGSVSLLSSNLHLPAEKQPNCFFYLNIKLGEMENGKGSSFIFSGLTIQTL